MKSVVAWRVVADEFAVPPYDPFDGHGSSLRGRRWNSRGVPAVYLSDAISLALLEVLVYYQKPEHAAKPFHVRGGDSGSVD